jgi:hypothetical protein
MSSSRQIENRVIASAAEGLASAKDVLCGEIVRVLASRYGTSLRAIVLTGSLARDEATSIRTAMGVRVLGDADCFVVFRDGNALPAADEALALANEAEAKAKAGGVVASISLAMVHGGYFERLPRHISAYELRSNGLVIWGENEILSLVPQFEASEVSIEDAWRMLANRLIEQFELRTESNGDSSGYPGPLQYRTAKFYLDMATSYLVFAGRYRPTYRERDEVLRMLASSEFADSTAPFPLGAFAERVSECTRYKVLGEPVACPEREFLEGALHYGRLLWAWELQRLSGRQMLSDPDELMAAWMARQSATARIRGWASVVRRAKWSECLRYGPRWVGLCRRASPRYWVYRAAAELLYARGAVERDWRRAARLLPVSDMPGAAADGRDSCRSLVRAVASNYHRFLETTEA